MKLSDRALSFAFRIFDVISNENEKPEILHSMIVGDIARSYGFDDSVVAACYLHEVVKKSRGEITLNDIARLFGGDVASLLMTANETDPNLSFKEMKKQRIKSCKDLPNRNKTIITSNLIAELEEMKESLIHDNNKEQIELYEAMLEALAEDFPHEIFDRLYESILNNFYCHNQINLPKIKKQTSQCDELNNLKELLAETGRKSFIIEFKNSDHENNKQITDVINDFFKDSYKIKISSSKENEYCPDNHCMDLIGRNLLVASELEAGLLSEVTNGKDIILLEAGLFERFIWLQRYLDTGKLSQEDYDDYIKHYARDLESIINYAIIGFSNNENEKAKKYDEALNNLANLIKGDKSLTVFENLLPIMKPESIKKLKLILENKKVA